MSNQPAVPLSDIPAPAYPRASTKSKISVAGLSLTGGVLFVTGLLVVASGYMSMRPEVMGLRVHPYLLPVALAFPLVVLARIADFPIRVLAALTTFTGMYAFSVFQGTSLPLGEVFKITSAFVTIVVCALLVRRRGDFVAGALGLSIAIALLAWPTLNESSSATLEVMEGANKNSYSLFALPALLLAGFISTRMRTVPFYIKGCLLATSLPAIVVIFMSANRSGYLGTVLVGFMLFWDRRGRGMLVVGAVALAAVFWLVSYGATDAFNQRMRMTAEGAESDTLRVNILYACAAIAMENPIIGVSPDTLRLEIGRRLNGGSVDAHNVFAHVAAGSGLICFAALLALLWTLYFWHPRGGRKITSKQDPLYTARSLMRMLVILWIVRGSFSREILYNPAFCIALGLTIGLCMLAEAERNSEPSGAALATGRGANGS